MSDPSPNRFDALKARTQDNLIQYLNVDLDLAFTFLQTVRIEIGFDAKHSNAVVEKARIALASIRKFQRHVEDQNASAKINDRASRLEAAIDGFERD